MATAEQSRITARELALVALGAAVFAIVLNWPLILNLGSHIPLDLGDPLPQAWQVSWGGHALIHQPLHFFDANQYWPFHQTLAFSDALIGYAPAGLIGSGPHDAVVRYDLLFLFAYALAFFGAYLLARELGLGPVAALVAGAAFAFAPYRIEQDGHLQVISSGGIPLALALGVRALRTRSPWAMLAGWLVALWQVSLGFSLGLPFGYLLLLLIAIAIVIWFRRGRPAPDRRLLAAALVGGLVFAICTGLLSIPYQHVADRFPQATRSPAVVAGYSGQPEAFLSASSENLIWGPITAVFRNDLSSVPEQSLFPGLLAVCLAIAGATWRGWPRGLRIGLAVGVIGISVLALGFEAEGGLLWPDRVLYDLLPGWHGIRTPGRLMTFASLALALLAAGGAQRVLTALSGRVSRAALAPAVVALFALVIAIEGRGLPFDPTDAMTQPPIPPPAVATGAPAPQLNLPAPAAERQPALPALVDRRLPGDGQRPLEHDPAVHHEPDREHGRFPGSRDRDAPAPARGRERDRPHRPGPRHRAGGLIRAADSRPRHHAQPPGRAGGLRRPVAEREARDRRGARGLAAEPRLSDSDQRGHRADPDQPERLPATLQRA